MLCGSFKHHFLPPAQLSLSAHLCWVFFPPLPDFGASLGDFQPGTFLRVAYRNGVGRQVAEPSGHAFEEGSRVPGTAGREARVAPFAVPSPGKWCCGSTPCASWERRSRKSLDGDPGRLRMPPWIGVGTRHASGGNGVIDVFGFFLSACWDINGWNAWDPGMLFPFMAFLSTHVPPLLPKLNELGSLVFAQTRKETTSSFCVSSSFFFSVHSNVNDADLEFEKNTANK